MTQIKHNIKINAPQEKVWEKIANLGAVKNYHPAVKQSHYTSEELEGVGASRHCDFGSGRSVEERVLEWHDGKEIALEIYEEKKMPSFKYAIGKQEIKANGNTTIATLEMN